MRLRAVFGAGFLIFAMVIVSFAQNKGVVQMDKPGPFRPGEQIVFNIKLNESLPKGAHFDFRISPVSADEEIPLGTGEPVNGSDREFRITTKLPEAALPGEWHISVIYFFLPGAGWTRQTLASNDLKFEVEGKAYPIPTKADVTVAH
jgi:hypothetical protein